MKKLLFLLVLVLILGMTTPALAVVISCTGTGDNQLGFWWYGAWNQAGDGWDDWTKVTTMSGDIPYGLSTTLYFGVMNDTEQTSGNPAGFLGEISIVGAFFKETGTNLLLTNDVNWEVAAVTEEVDPTSSGINWVSATSYGANNAGGNLWSAVSGIDGNAEWIWTANNDYNNFSTMDQAAIFRTTVTPIVPEPVTMSLMGLGLLGFGVTRKRKQ